MTMTWIAGQDLSGAAGDVSFGNIPQTFTHLQVRVFARSTSAANLRYCGIYFNNAPTSNNYPQHFLQGDGASASSGSELADNQFAVIGTCPGSTATANAFGVQIWDILDYTNTNKNKTVRLLVGFDGNGSGFARLGSGLWLSTAAINRVNVTTVSNFASGSRIDLYGIGVSEQTGA